MKYKKNVITLKYKVKKKTLEFFSVNIGNLLKSKNNIIFI